MAALPSDLMRGFVRAYVARGLKNASRAYEDAGYTVKNDNVARVEAHHLVHDPRIQEAIREVCMKEFVALVPMAQRVMTDLAENPQIESSVRLKAATAIMDRAGMNVVSEQKITVEHIGDDPAKVARAKMLMQRLGLDSDKASTILGRRLTEKVIEAEFEEVPSDEELKW